jgi:hypothetical protein
MTPKEEFRALKNRLNSDRAKEKIDFDSMKRETQRGNTYLRITCNDPMMARDIKSQYKREVRRYTYMTYDEMKTSATKYKYIYFVMYNKTF